MNTTELKKSLGSIGFSGSLEYLKNAKDSKDVSSIIGQFGVGFYSSFMVGDKVVVYSKPALDPNAKGHAWIYDGLVLILSNLLK
jgi:TNF receptor-associated protein 1